MQFKKILFQFTSWQIKGLTSLIMIALTIFVNNTEAQAKANVESVPRPDSAPATGIGGQGIEGILDLKSDTTLEFPLEFEIRPDLSVRDNSLSPSSVIGEGNLLNIAQTAADVWSTAFPELPDFNIGVGWADFDLTNLGASSGAFTSSLFGGGIPTDGLAAFYIHADDNFPDANEVIPGSDLDGLILFNSQENLELEEGGSIKYYFDPDPLNSPIFGKIESYFEREKNGINYGRSKFVSTDFPISDSTDDPFASFGVNPNDLVADAFSIFLHEIQHALGLTRINPDATETGKLIDTDTQEFSNLDLRINAGDFAGTIIPTTYNGFDTSSLHLNDDLKNDPEFNFESSPSVITRANIIKENQIPTPVSLGIVTDRERKCPSAADIVAIAEINGYTNYDTNPCKTLARQKVPEPSSILFFIALGTFGGWQLGRQNNLAHRF